MQSLDQLQQLAQVMGIPLPSIEYIFGAIAFSIVGLFIWRFAKKKNWPTGKWGGLFLMFFTYVVHDTFLMYLIGVSTIGCLYSFWRSRTY